MADNTAMTNVVRLKPMRGDEAGCEVRMDKVERLRAAIAEGRYSVSSEALADKLIEHMGELGPTKKGKRKR